MFILVKQPFQYDDKPNHKRCLTCGQQFKNEWHDGKATTSKEYYIHEASHDPNEDEDENLKKLREDYQNKKKSKVPKKKAKNLLIQKTLDSSSFSMKKCILMFVIQKISTRIKLLSMQIMKR